MAVRATNVPGKARDHANDAEEPFYGWRFLRRKAANGRYEYVQVPLTFDDLLNPQEGDQVIHSAKHQRILHYLRNVLEGRVYHDPTALILDDVLIDWGIPGLRKHGPDIAVFFGIRECKNWTTFSVVTEGVRPTIIVEIASPDTARHDRTTKVQEYHRAGVPIYILIDYVRQPRLEQRSWLATAGARTVMRPWSRTPRVVSGSTRCGSGSALTTTNSSVMTNRGK